MTLGEWLNNLNTLPYFERRMEIARRVQPPQSRFLYKYKSIDATSPTSIDRLRDLLVRSRFWLSSPHDFNDPFDMSAKIVAKATADEKLWRINALMRGRGLSYSKRVKTRKRFMRMSIDELEKELRKHHKIQIEKTGIFSFAGDAKDILMWSHYAMEHTGVCLQFERAQDYKTLYQATPVEYSSEYPEINWIKDFQESLSNALLRKYEGWSYEKEQRIVLVGLAHTYLQFDPRALVGLIIGCRITRNGHAIIQSILDERQRANLPAIRLFFAQKHSSNYRLEVFIADRNKSV